MDNIELFIAKDNLNVSEAMQKIDKNANGILFLTDSNGKLHGCSYMREMATKSRIKKLLMFLW